YANAIARMTREAVEVAGVGVASLPLVREHDAQRRVALLLITGDRGLAGALNSQILRAGVRAGSEHEAAAREIAWFASGRRGASSLTFRGREPRAAYVGFSERPAYADARGIARDLMSAYLDEHVDRVEVLYNGYVSPLVQEVRREVLLPLTAATLLGEEEREGERGGPKALVDYEPDAAQIVGRLVPDYVEIAIYR